MCIPPLMKTRAAFSADARTGAQTPVAASQHGMSADFETAIACGATEIRVGTAIFGERSA